MPASALSTPPRAFRSLPALTVIGVALACSAAGASPAGGADATGGPSATPGPSAQDVQSVPGMRSPHGDLPGAREEMTPGRLRELVGRIDPEARTRGNVWEFTVDGSNLALVFDSGADRMRLMLAVTDAAELDARMMERLLEANFDATLDARYAIARGTLWATFLHPLSSLTDELFLSAIAQTVGIARNYGTTFSSETGFGGRD